MNGLKRLIVIMVCFTMSACDAFDHADKDEILGTHYSGAYRLDDGTLFTLGPSTEERMRMLRYHDGQPFSLYHKGDNQFSVSKGFNSRDMLADGQLVLAHDGQVIGIDWQQDGIQRLAKRLPIRKKEVFFQSDGLRLRGELSLPEGEHDFPVVIAVHGSEDYSAVDYNHWPYVFAANGLAGFKFDKRGTGGSQGEYTQDFPTLARDVVAAINYLKVNHNIDQERINLIGFSQGGWIMPLVASQVDIRSYLVAFGTTVPTRDEDRWGYVKRLLDNGFSEQEIAAADAINEQLSKIIWLHDESAWDTLLSMVERNKETAWFKTVSGSDSLLGFVAEKVSHPLANLMPDVGWKLYTRWQKGDNTAEPSFNYRYQPLDTLRNVASPSMWLLAGEDTSLPTPKTAQELALLQGEGLPIEYTIYPQAEHGNLEYIIDEHGNKTYTNYVSDYFTDAVTWIRSQNGL